MRRGSWGKGGLIAVVFALLIATTAPAAVGATGDESVWAASDEFGDRSASDAAQQEPPAENNSSVAHRNPSEVSGGGSLSDVEVWISREMYGELSESANVSEEDRERARELIGNDSEYAELAEQYAEVANRSGSQSRAADFAAAGQLQRQFFVDVEQYYRVHGAYRDARASNESDRTLRLAHELERRAAAVNRTAALLNRSYANISGEGQGDLRNATRTIGEMRANVVGTQQTVRDRTLVRTELSIRATEPEGSFADPVPLAGRLQTADGDSIADENVTLRIGNRTINTTTDEEGRFEVAYRPTLAPVGDRPRTVVFRPGNESAYLWAAANATFGVEQVTPNVTVSNRTATARYNRTLTVNGTVAAGDVGVPDVPVVVTVDGVRIAQARTDADGSFGVAGRLLANVSNGSQSVRVQVATGNVTPSAFGPGALGSGAVGPGAVDSSAVGPSERGSEGDSGSGSDSNDSTRDVAIAPTNRSAEITVETTPTALSITDVQTFNETALVTGRLATEAGEPVPNQTVELRIDGRSVGTTTTNATGGFATTVGLPSRLLGGDSTVRVVAAYSPSGGNLAPATADRTATVGSTGVAISDQQLRFGAAALLAVAAFGAFVWRFRSSGDGSSDGEADQVAGEANEEDADARPPEFADVRGHSAEALFDSARTALDDGDFDAAVVSAYGAIRRGFEDADVPRREGDGQGRTGDGPSRGGDGQRGRDDGQRREDDGVSRRSDGSRWGANGRRTHRTHWEFYAAARDAGLSEEERRRLERLTETYERAAFADESVSEADAREAVEDATALRETADPESITARRGVRRTP